MFKIVEELLRDSEELQGAEIAPNTDPFNELGKDSHDGVVFACLLSERLGVEIPPDQNPLIDDAHHRPRLVGEVVDWCLEVLKHNKPENSHAAN